MNFLSIDQHISVSADIRNIFNNLGHTVREISLSGHASVIGRPVEFIPMLAGDGWCSTIHDRKFKEFHDTYKDLLNQFDGFICCYPPIFSMLYRYTNKPIIIQVPIRYECGADCNAELWKEFNDYLIEGVENGKIFLCANNLYDKKYIESFIKCEVNYIPSLCEYTGMSFNPVNEMYLYYSSFHVKDESGRMIKKHDAMRGGHAWQNIADYKGVFHYPYNISTMSIFEQYTANIPLFFPTKEYLIQLWSRGLQVLDQISWQQQVQNSVCKSLIPCNCGYDPNNFRSVECISHWLDYADFYNDNMRHIQYFSNNEQRDDLLSLSKNDLLDISLEMMKHNSIRKSVVYNEWSDLLNEVQKCQ